MKIKMLALVASLLVSTLSYAQHHNPSTLSPSQEAYSVAMDAMHDPMMEGVMEVDPDIAFIKGMIPHHQGAIDMARIVIQYGKDPEVRKLAEQVIDAQEKEIAWMNTWLQENTQK